MSPPDPQKTVLLKIELIVAVNGSALIGMCLAPWTSLERAWNETRTRCVKVLRLAVKSGIGDLLSRSCFLYRVIRFLQQMRQLQMTVRQLFKQQA
jgi:hypothetical protein